MRRPKLPHSLPALLSGLLLAACGGPLEAELTPPAEPSGVLESALCSGLSVSSLTLSGISTYQGEMAGGGNWLVSPGANAVRLEYYVDGMLYGVEERTGSSGTWYFSASGIACGTRTFMVKAFPMVIDSSGNRTTCYASPRSFSQSVTEACFTAAMSCSRVSSTTVRCNGSASGGNGTLTPYWQQSDPWGSGGWFAGTMTQSFSCVSPTTSCYSNPISVRFEFKVYDSSGRVTNTVGQNFSCDEGLMLQGQQDVRPARLPCY